MPHRHRRFACLIVALGTAVASAQARNQPPRYDAEPSVALAAEIEFAHAAREKGAWPALLKRAAPGAILFVPQRVLAAQWLKGRASPPPADRWSPREVWMSCDGSAALIAGDWAAGKAHGQFVAVWQQQRDGAFKWVLRDAESGTDAAPAADDLPTIAAHLADCPKRDEKATIARWLAQPAPGGGTGAEDKASAADQTLHWEASSQADGAHHISAWMWKDGAMRPIYTNEVVAPGSH